MQIKLVKNVRLFKRAFPAPALLLSQTGRVLRRNKTIEISKPQTMTYDHDDKVVVSTICDGQEFFILVEEIGNLNTAHA